jgi:Protein of unknown function (DUF3558)
LRAGGHPDRCRYPASHDAQPAAIQGNDPVRHRLPALAVAAALLIATLAACSHGSSGAGGQPSAKPSGSAGAGHGPFFPECGGVSDQTVSQLTRVTGLVNTARNSVGCQWLAGGGILGPHFSFTWYRGSPIGRERKTEELSRASVEDLNIDGKNGWVAIGTDPILGNSLCEVGIQFNNDFFEWSVSFSEKPFPDPCDIAKELSHQSIAAAK